MIWYICNCINSRVVGKGDFVEISSHLTNTGIGAIAVVGLGFYAGMQIVSDDPGQIRLPLGARIILSLSLVFTAFIVSLTLKSTVSNLVLLGMILSFSETCLTQR